MRVKILLSTCVAGAVLGSGAGTLRAQSAQPSTGTATPRTTEQVYKNIQVLKGFPSDQLIPAMQFVAASLGVQCDFCHLENAFEKDDKQTKQTARTMMRMMFAINKDNFDGQQKVTCYACHRGAHKPVITPIISEEDGKSVVEEKMPHEAPNTAGLPSADQVIGKYLQAVGGAEAASRISTRIQKGTLAVGSELFPVEVLAKAPANRVTTVRFPGGNSVTGVNRDEGWLSTPGREVHDMSPSEVDAARTDAELFFPNRLKLIFKEFRMQQKEQVNGHETYVVLGMRDNQPPAQLYFDQESGRLVRVLRFVVTPLGSNPTQIDYADYREEGGLKTPFRWTVVRPNGRFTIQIEQMQQNIPIEDDKFAKPAAGNAGVCSLPVSSLWIQPVLVCEPTYGETDRCIGPSKSPVFSPLGSQVLPPSCFNGLRYRNCT
jgi:photosynthetic reaction center cytochrome c subunit